MRRKHAMPFGAEVCDDGAVLFRLWAPKASHVSLVLESARELEMSRADSCFELQTPEARPGSRYQFRIDHDQLVPDPASRFQPQGVHQGSEVIDPFAFEDRKSTRLNSSHVKISYAVFCLKKKKKNNT